MLSPHHTIRYLNPRPTSIPSLPHIVTNSIHNPPHTHSINIRTPPNPRPTTSSPPPIPRSLRAVMPRTPVCRISHQPRNPPPIPPPLHAPRNPRLNLRGAGSPTSGKRLLICPRSNTLRPSRPFSTYSTTVRRPSLRILRVRRTEEIRCTGMTSPCSRGACFQPRREYHTPRLPSPPPIIHSITRNRCMIIYSSFNRRLWSAYILYF